MMDYGGFGWMGGFGWLWMVLFWLITIGLVAWAVTALFPYRPSGRNTALEVLQRRYGSGEITAADYEQARKALS